MKKFTLIISLSLIFILVKSNSFGLAPYVKTNLGNHMYEVNKNWVGNNNQLLKNSMSFFSDIERIQCHLFFVESELRKKGTIDLTDVQKKNRELVLDILHQYALICKFPVNTGHKERQPYFIDVYGTYCAVGYLVKETGYDEVSKEISHHQNFAYVREIQSADLIKWSEKFGFTIDELAFIQPTYPPSASYTQVEGGSNGNVTCSATYYNKWFVGGDFDTLNNLPCFNVGVYSNNQLSCFGNGIEGQVIGVGPFGATGVSVGGNLPFNNKIYPIANYNGTEWLYDSIPNRTNPIVTAFYTNGNMLRLAIDHPTNINEQEIWQLYQGNWTIEAIVKGKVYYIDKNINLYAGEFDSVQIVSNSTWYSTKNIIYNLNGWQTVQGEIPDVVKTVEVIGQTLYIGGTFATTPDPASIILTRHLNGTSQPLLTVGNFDSFSSPCVNDIVFFSTGSLLVAGNLPMNQGWMYFGKNLLKFDLVQGNFAPYALFNDEINTIGKNNDTYYFGGDFTGQFGSANNLKHLAQHESNVGIEEISIVDELTLYPNPSVGKLMVNGLKPDQIATIEIQDLQGKIWLKVTSNQNWLDASNLPNGMYLVKITQENRKSITLKWMKAEE